MKCKLLSLIFLFGSTLNSFARDFSYTYEGQTIVYTVLDEEAKTAEIQRQQVSGNLILPQHPFDGNTEYTLTQIGERAFYFCRELTNVTIPNSVVSIGVNAFYSCNRLTSITIPASVTTIGETAFSGCSDMVEFKVENGNQNYTARNGVLFNYDRSSLIQYPIGKPETTYTIPSSVNTIEAEAFAYCNLTNIILPQFLFTIKEQAFYFSLLTKLTIPKSVTTIGDEAISTCWLLTEISVNSENPNFTSENGVLFNHDKTSLLQYPIAKSDNSYEIPNSVKFIGNSAFSDSRNLKEIIIPNSVTAIGNHAFEYCDKVTDFVIPGSVETIGTWAFADCDDLKSVTCNRELPPTIGTEAFYNYQGKYETLFVPESAVEDYANSYWNQFFMSMTGISEGSIEQVETDSTVKFTLEGNTINLQGVATNEVVRVYDMSGINVYSGNDHSITLKNGKVYILTINSRNYKIKL